MVDMERVLRREHKIRPGAENDFQVRNQREFLATQQAGDAGVHGAAGLASRR